MVELNFAKAEICVAEGTVWIFSPRKCEFGKRMRVFVAQQPDYMTGLVVVGLVTGKMSGTDDKSFASLKLKCAILSLPKGRNCGKGEENAWFILYTVAARIC